MPSSPVLIVAAMAEELAPLRRLLLGASGTRDRVRGEIDGQSVVLARLGEGHGAGAVAARLITELRPRFVWLVGVAGGLTDPPTVGEALIAAQVVSPEGEVLLPTRGQVDGALSATVVSVERWASRAKKAALAEALCGDPGVVDLESLAVGQAAERAQLPWAVIRAVSDGHDEELPSVLHGSQRTDGSAHRLRIVARGFTRPSGPFQLARLAGRSRAAALAAAALLRRALQNS